MVCFVYTRIVITIQHVIFLTKIKQKLEKSNFVQQSSVQNNNKNEWNNKSVSSTFMR